MSNKRKYGGKKGSAGNAALGVGNKYLEKLSMLYIAFILAVFPILLGPQGYLALTEAKFQIFTWSSAIFIFIGIILLIAAFISKKQKTSKLMEGVQKFTLPQILIIAYIIWCAISALASDFRADTIIGQGRYEGLLSIFMYGTVFIFISFWGKYSDKFFIACSIVMGFLGIVSLLQLFGTNLIYPEGYTYWNSSFLATIGNIDLVSGFIAIVIPMTACCYVLVDVGKVTRGVLLSVIGILFYVQLCINVDGGKLGIMMGFLIILPFLIDRLKRISKFCMMVFTILLAFAVHGFIQPSGEGTVTGFSTTALVALILAAGFLALSIVLGKKKEFSKLSPSKLRKVEFIVIGACILAGLIFVFVYSGDSGLLSQAHQFMHGNIDDNIGSGRGYIWKNSIKAIAQNPIIGTGPGTFTSAFADYQEGWQQLTQTNQIVDFPHNDLLQIGTCQGVIGLAIYLAFLITLYIKAYRYMGENSKIAIILAGMTGYLVYSFFTFSIAIITPLFWVMAGMLDKYIRPLAGNRVKKEKKEVSN